METNETKDFEVLSPDPADFIEDNDEVILDAFPDPAADQEATPDPDQPVQVRRYENYHLTDIEFLRLNCNYTRLLERIVNALFDLRFKKYMTANEFDDLFSFLKPCMDGALKDLNELKEVYDCYYVNSAIENVELQINKFNSICH